MNNDEERRADSGDEDQTEADKTPLTGPLSAFKDCVEKPVKVGLMLKDGDRAQRRMTGTV